MTEPVPALDDTQDEQAAREWADGLAETVGRIWLARFPGGKDWGLTK